MEERQGQAPGVAAYLVETVCEQCDNDHHAAVTVPTMNVVISSLPTHIRDGVSLDKEGL